MKRYLLLLTLACCIALPAFAQDVHVVPSAELEQSLANAAETRRQNEADLQRLVANEQVRKAATAAGINPEQVREAIPQLDDETLADLAARARHLEEDVAGGFVGGILIVLILIVLLAVLIAVYVIN